MSFATYSGRSSLYNLWQQLRSTWSFSILSGSRSWFFLRYVGCVLCIISCSTGYFIDCNKLGAASFMSMAPIPALIEWVKRVLAMSIKHIVCLAIVMPLWVACQWRLFIWTRGRQQPTLFSKELIISEHSARCVHDTDYNIMIQGWLQQGFVVYSRSKITWGPWRI